MTAQHAPVGTDRQRVLIIEDAPDVSDLLSTAIGFEGYAVEQCADGALAMEHVARFRPDLIVLDVMLPHVDGFELQRRLTPVDDGGPSVLMLTARDAPGDAVRALDLGAEDYVTKPFSLEEVLARVRAVLRRRARYGGDVGAGDGDVVVRYADLSLDPVTREVRRGELSVELTPREFDLLHYLLRNAGRVLTKDQILDAVWQYDFGGDSGVLERYVSYLRRKVDAMGDPLIQTVRGVGYALREPRS